MSENKINRRGVCKSLLAFGGLALGCMAAKGQTPAPTPTQPLTGDVLDDQKIADAVKRGATMEEIAQLRDPIARTPQEALRALKTGNARFFGGQARRPEASAAERRAQILGQTPFAVIWPVPTVASRRKSFSTKGWELCLLPALPEMWLRWGRRAASSMPSTI